MYLKRSFLLTVTMSILSICSQSELFAQNHPPTDAYGGWRLGIQAWTFNRYSFYEAIDKTASLGLDWIEAYPNQRLSKEHGDATMGHDMAEELREEVRKKLAESGVRLVNYGVVALPNDEKQCRKVFDFAKDMGIETIVSEPPEDAFNLIDRLCKEYKIKVAIHNHPKPSHYWNPDTVLKVCKGRSEWIGACADTGHWVRSGLDPVECLKKLEGRILSAHFKEIVDGHDTVWGTGDKRAEPLLKELDRQKFQGVFSIEYEYNWETSIPEIRQCVAFFDKVGSKMKPTGWRNLFAADLSNADLNKGGWAFEEGVLTLKAGGDIWTKQKYSDFILDLEFKVDESTNSGVLIRTQDHNWLPWIEVQVADSYGAPLSRHICGGIFDILEPAKNAARPVGAWNMLTIEAKGPKVKVIMNNEPIIDMDLDKWTEAYKNPDGSQNKFDIAYRDLPRTGFIGLQDHGTKVWYRNLKIKEL